MRYDGDTLTLTPWAAQALSDDELHSLAVRAVDLHCRIDAGKSHRDQQWVIRVSSWAKDTISHDPLTYLERRWFAGLHLADCIGQALDDYSLAVRYSPEEILQIANQSGIVA